MNNLFDAFDEGSLALPASKVDFKELSWTKHPSFDGVELKHLITGEYTDGAFSFHLVRIAPNKEIGLHTHELQLETHEVIFGSGTCINHDVFLDYQSGVISIFPKKIPHKVIAGSNGLYLFAKFFPALC